MAATLAFAGSGLGILLRQAWWPSLTVVAASFSLAVIVPWWTSVPPRAKLGAAFDLVILLTLLLPPRAGVLGLVK